MDQQILQKLTEQDKKIEAIYQSVEKTRKYFMWTLIVTAIVVVLPLIGLLFVLPGFLSAYSSLGI